MVIWRKLVNDVKLYMNLKNHFSQYMTMSHIEQGFFGPLTVATSKVIHHLFTNVTI